MALVKEQNLFFPKINLSTNKQKKTKGAGVTALIIQAENDLKKPPLWNASSSHQAMTTTKNSEINDTSKNESDTLKTSLQVYLVYWTNNWWLVNKYYSSNWNARYDLQEFIILNVSTGAGETNLAEETNKNVKNRWH